MSVLFFELRFEADLLFIQHGKHILAHLLTVYGFVNFIDRQVHSYPCCDRKGRSAGKHERAADRAGRTRCRACCGAGCQASEHAGNNASAGRTGGHPGPGSRS